MYVCRIPTSLQEPLPPAVARQLVPTAEEQLKRPHFTVNPLKEQAPTPENKPFLLQKYAGRALLVTTPLCFGNCRFCFRRHLRQETDFSADFSDALEALRENTSLSELILSGGDPLTLDDAPLGKLLGELGKIPHLRRLRFHTRAVTFCPERVTPNLLALMKDCGKTVYWVLHINHRDELTPQAKDAIRRLIDVGIPLLQQGVLLHGVNDTVDALAELYETLADLRVVPYYLHQLDRVQGAAHFEVPVEMGRKFMRELRKRLPGYAVPLYVREIPGELAKHVLGEEALG